jgi:hypothetical protein
MVSGGHDHVPCQSAGKPSKVTPISARLHLRVQRFERSEAVERFERIERAAVLNAPIRDVATSTLPVFRAQIQPQHSEFTEIRPRE